MDQLHLTGWPEHLISIAEVIGDRYSFERKAGEGKTATAYQIIDISSQRSFCLKTIAEKVEEAERPGVRDSIGKEVAILDPLNHSALPRIYERDTSAKLPFYVCTFHPGFTFQSFKTTGARLSPDKSLFVVNILLDALNYLHRHGRTHCDFHPNNILIDDDVFAHGILVIDFGSGHRASDPSANTDQRGDFRYKATPDQAKFRNQVNRASSAAGFQHQDFTALGDLLALMADCFFGSAPADHRIAYLRFCHLLKSGHVTDWESARRYFAAVVDPDFLVSGIDRHFLSPSGTRGSIRLPVSGEVAVGEATLAVINTPEFQKLRAIKQLSFCDWIYPGGTHSRFEHVLGVMRTMHRALKHLSRTVDFRDRFTSKNVEGAVLAGLVHDIGHYPFAHVMEHYVSSRFSDNREARQIVNHAQNTIAILEGPGVVQEAIDTHWGEDVRYEALKVLEGKIPVVSELLDGPIDCDKLDYLQRDAHHCGVPFGAGIDVSGIIGNLRCSSNATRLGISRRGVTAVEGLMIAQEQMLDAVYWNETVRAVVAMFHAVIATFVSDDLAHLSSLVAALKKCNSDFQALQEVFLPRIRSLQPEQQKAVHQLYRMHVTPRYKDIYLPIKKYTVTDEEPNYSSARTSIYHAIIKQQISNTSTIPIQWPAIRRLRSAYQEAFREKRPNDRIGPYEILVDVPWGKAANRMVRVVEDSGDERDICDVSHLDQTIFEQLTMYLAPIRVFIAPRLAEEYEQHLAAICSSAESRFYDVTASLPAAEFE